MHIWYHRPISHIAFMALVTSSIITGSTHRIAFYRYYIPLWKEQWGMSVLCVCAMHIFSCPSTRQMNANICWAVIRIRGGPSKVRALHWGMCLWNTNLLISLKGSGPLSPQCDKWSDHTAMWAHTHTHYVLYMCTNINMHKHTAMYLHFIGGCINVVYMYVVALLL